MTSVTLVSTDVTPSLEQLTCLAEWSASGQTVNVAGQPVQVSSNTPIPGSTTAQATQATQKPTGGANISWVYAIVAIVVVGIIIAFLLIIVILVVRRRDKQPER